MTHRCKRSRTRINDIFLWQLKANLIKRKSASQFCVKGEVLSMQA